MTAMTSKKRPVALSINSIFLGIVALTSLYLILLSFTPLNVTPDLGGGGGIKGATSNNNGNTNNNSPSRLDGSAASLRKDVPGAPATPTIDPPQPHILTKSDGVKLYDQTLYMHGQKLNFVIREASHFSLIKGHVFRETASYALLKDAVEQAKKHKPNERPLVLDVGGNHGLYSIFAARLGADVLAIEPQEELANCIAHSAKNMNGDDVAERIKVYNYAVLSTREFVSMTGQEEGEGAAANVVREDVFKPGMVETRPISDFLPPEETRDVC